MNALGWLIAVLVFYAAWYPEHLGRNIANGVRAYREHLKETSE